MLQQPRSLIVATIPYIVQYYVQTPILSNARSEYRQATGAYRARNTQRDDRV